MMVYLAADNNLAADGYLDIEEMEAAGYDPEVQVVMQAEFSAEYMSQRGFTPGSIGLEDWKTFRYAVGDDTRGVGIDGEVTYSSAAVDMSNPASLVDFVQWAQSTYPSERSILVPWNHGGGYTGLIEDGTDGGGSMMTLSEFNSALGSLPLIDIIDFDMCSMGGYTTLAQLVGEADVAVFSQELVPGRGLPYTEVLDAIQNSPTSSTEAVAASMVNEYADHYNGDRSSITKSAYSLSGFGLFDAAMSDLAVLLNARITSASWRSLIQSILINTQRYSLQEMKDIVDFAKLFKLNTTDTELITGLDNVISAATSPSFRLANRYYTAPGGTLSSANDVDGSWGLNVVFPAGIDSDKMKVSGSRSLATYIATTPTAAWTAFLNNWTAYLTLSPVVDQGTGTRFEFLQIWDTVTSNNAEADVDLWLYEPDGRTWIPYLGTVTGNGLLTGDSWTTGAYYEGWRSNQVAETGTYVIYAHQWTAPSSVTSVIDIAYRYRWDQAWSYLYGAGTYPTLDQSVRFEDDGSPSFAEANLGFYSNFKLVATWTPAAPSSAEMAAGQTPPSGPGLQPVDREGLAQADLGDRMPTSEDIARLQQLISEKQRIQTQEGGIDVGAEGSAGLPLSGGPRRPPSSRSPGNWRAFSQILGQINPSQSNRLG
jgi:hypothetical protein